MPLPVSTPEVSEYFVAGSSSGGDPAVVLLVDSISDVEKTWAESAAEELGGSALVFVATDVFPTENITGNHLKAAIASTDEFEGTALPPVVGFGGAATHTMLLAFDEWVMHNFLAAELRVLGFARPNSRFKPPPPPPPPLLPGPELSQLCPCWALLPGWASPLL